MFVYLFVVVVVAGCLAVSCDFGVFSREGELKSFYFTLFQNQGAAFTLDVCCLLPPCVGHDPLDMRYVGTLCTLLQ